jgi:ribosomal protein S12 methylthiotransferase accessory factor YcaO
VFLLGPGLSLIRLEVGSGVPDEAAITQALAQSMGIERAVESGFLEYMMEPVDSSPGPPGQRPAEPVAGVIVCDDAALARACADLVRQLSVEGAGRWAVTTGGELPLPIEPPPFVIMAAHRAAVRHRPATLPVGGRVLDIGESFEGTYIAGAETASTDGATPAAIADHWSPGSARWAFEARLDALGFTERPVPFRYRLQTDPVGLARAIRTATGLGPGTAVLTVDQRTVAFATPDAVRSTSFNGVPRAQAWTFGMARGLEARPGSIVGSYVATCRTPAGGQDHLEGNSGKGITPEAAITGAVGEALERFAAYEANWSLPPARDALQRIDIADLHPYGAAWERQRRAAAAPVACVEGFRLADGAIVAVPKALVTFPYLGADRPTDGITTGLAAAPDSDSAVLRGLREVLERDNLYNAFTEMRPGLRLDLTEVLGQLGLDSAFRGDVWAVHWPHDGYVLPDVHAFHHDPHTGVLVRASGSGVSFQEAAEDALTELCQVHFEAVRAGAAGEATSPAHAEWARPSVIDKARRYLDAQCHGDPLAVPYSDDTAQLDYLVRRLVDLGTGPIGVRLPLRGPDWTVVRVLVPGATTSPYASQSRGGRRLLNPHWSHGIPT